MVMPSFNMMYQLDCIDTIEFQGERIYVRKFEDAFLKSTSLKSGITAIENLFNSYGLELRSLEQSLNALRTRSTRNSVNRVRTDPNTALLRSVNPDLILELTYEYKNGPFGNKLTFILNALDAYSNKSVASISSPGENGTETDLATLIKNEIELNGQSFMNDLQAFGQRLDTDGREVNLFLQVAEDSEVDFQRDRCGAERMSEVIQGWLRENTVKGRFNRDYLTQYEYAFSDVRIPRINTEGYGIQVNDWLLGLSDHLYKTCKKEPLDMSTGLGNGVLIFE